MRELVDLIMASLLVSAHDIDAKGSGVLGADLISGSEISAISDTATVTVSQSFSCASEVRTMRRGKIR